MIDKFIDFWNTDNFGKWDWRWFVAIPARLIGQLLATIFVLILPFLPGVALAGLIWGITALIGHPMGPDGFGLMIFFGGFSWFICVAWALE